MRHEGRGFSGRDPPAIESAYGTPARGPDPSAWRVRSRLRRARGDASGSVHLAPCELEARPSAVAGHAGTYGKHAHVPTALLETTGAKSGARRRNAIIYFHDGERVIVAASNAGSPRRNPSWYHNLRAHPEVVFGGIAMRATVVDDETERDRLWQLADNVFPAFASYRTDAAKVNRVIPIVQLTPQ
jgi:deazaflavin-dependent oxidoreductase (nitroreductase family)